MKPCEHILKFKRINDDAVIPFYATSGSAGMDLVSVSDDFFIKSGEVRKVHTGIAVEIPCGYEGQVRSRSGLSTRRIFVINSPGTIDSDYRGEIIVLLYNASYSDFHILKGNRIAQLVIAPVCTFPIKEVSELDVTERGCGGLGSTGGVCNCGKDD